MRYILRSPPLLEWNTITQLLIILFSIIILSFSFPQLSSLASIHRLRQYPLFSGLVLFGFLFPCLGALLYGPAIHEFLYDLSPIIFLAAFFTLHSVFTSALSSMDGLIPASGSPTTSSPATGTRAPGGGHIFGREISYAAAGRTAGFIVLAFGFFIGMVYLQDLAGVLHKLAEAGFSTDRLTRMLNRAKDRHREMVVIVPGLLLSFSVLIYSPKVAQLWHSRQAALMGRFLVACIFIISLGATLTFNSRNQWLSSVVSLAGMVVVFFVQGRLARHQTFIKWTVGVSAATVIGVHMLNPLGRMQHRAQAKDTIAIRYTERLAMLTQLDGNYFTGRGHGSQFTSTHEFYRPHPKKPKKKKLVRTEKKAWKSHNSWWNFFYKGGLPLFAFMVLMQITVIVSLAGRLLAGSSIQTSAGLLSYYLFGYFLYHLIRSGQDAVYYGHEQIAWLTIHLALFYAVRENSART